MSLVCLAGLFACAEDHSDSAEGVEYRSLREWMKLHRPKLVENYQSDGAYYVDVLSLGDPDSAPIRDTIYWVSFEFTGRTIAGEVCLTRDSLYALQQGTFTPYTHYVPFFRYCGEVNQSIVEGSYLAMRNPLTLGEEYAREHGYPTTVEMRLGTEVMLYMPSTVVGSLVGTGGYEGQYSLDANRPLMARMKVTGMVKNPLEAEGEKVDAFARDNGGLLPPVGVGASDRMARHGAGRDGDGLGDAGYAWQSVADTIPQLYVYRTYFPSTRTDSLFRYADPYFTDEAKPQEIDRRINEALLERFGAGTLMGNAVELEGRAKIWYICRFLDGFVVDTNIDEVKKIVYGEVVKKGSVYSYSPENDRGDNIQAWYYAIPNLRFGQWAALLTTSTNAYGTTGVAGKTNTSSSSSGANYSSMLNMYNYYNSYYGNSYYGGYYNGYYGNYMGGYYGNYYPTTTDQTTTTTTTVTTEIQAFTPLLFQIYIEPEAD